MDTRNVTMLDLVTAVSDFAQSDAEIVATVAYMVNRGSVRLCGSFAGKTFDLGALGLPGHSKAAA